MYIECYNGSELKNQTIWKYMDIIKFISLISTETLYFPSITELRHIDPFDSKLPKLDRIQFDNLHKFVKTIEEKSKKENNTYYCNLDPCINYLRELIGINCWFMSEYENYSMWKSYSDIKFGIAICSSVEDLKNSIHGEDKDTALIGKISYDIHKKANGIADIIDKSIYYPFFTKRIEYTNEKELRIIISKSKNFKIDLLKEHSVQKAVYVKSLKGYLCAMAEEYSSIKENNEQVRAGLSVDIKKLIKKVYIAPDAPDYFVGIVNSIIEQYNFKGIKLQKSTFFSE